MYDRTKLQDTLQKAEYRTIDENGKVLPPSHDVFKRISEHMNNIGSAITAKHIYTILNTNRGGMKTHVMHVLCVCLT